VGALRTAFLTWMIAVSATGAERAVADKRFPSGTKASSTP